jgi:hypothetical protein
LKGRIPTIFPLSVFGVTNMRMAGQGNLEFMTGLDPTDFLEELD